MISKLGDVNMETKCPACEKVGQKGTLHEEGIEIPGYGRFWHFVCKNPDCIFYGLSEPEPLPHIESTRITL